MSATIDAKLVFGVQVDEDTEPAVREFMDSRYDELESIEDAIGGCLTHHCSGSYTMYIVGTREMRAWRGSPVEVTDISVTEKDYETVQKMCNALGVPYDRSKCKWWLCSYWG